MNIIGNNIPDLDKAVEHFKQEIASLKTGRANPAILDNIRVEAYGVKTPVNQLASVTVADGRSILVQPWDKSILKDIEKAIAESDLGLAPANEGEKIRISVPVMTEEARKEIAKVLNQKAETAKIAVRVLRDKIKEQIMEAEKNKEFGEDEKFNLMEELDKKIGGYNEKIKELADEKETEIMTV